MAKRYLNKLAVLAKAESIYGTDPTPTGSENAILVKNVTIEPLLGTDIRRELVLPYFGHQGLILDGHHTRLTFDIEIAGAGAAGDAPGYGPVLRMCGLAETITEDTDVEYSLLSGGYASGTLYYVLDGVRHILLGARGNLQAPELRSLALGHFRVTITGLSGTITDQAMPTVDLTGFVKPVPINKANTALSVHGVALPIEQVAIDWGQQVEPRFLINYEGIEIVNRESTGSLVIEAASMATKDWFAIAKAGTLGALSLVHGTTAGNIVEITAPKVQIGRPTQGATQNIANYTLPLIFQPDEGDDELLITVK